MKTFLCEYIHPEARKALEEISEIVSDWDRFPECDAIINRNLQLTEDVLKKASNLKVIAVHGTGLDGVNLSAAEALKIKVFNTPHRNAASVAELNIALMLMAARKVSVIQKHMEAGNSFAEPSVMSALQGIELGGKTVAFLGVGEIAKRTIIICQSGFAMHCIGWSRSLTEEKAAELGIEYADSIITAVKNADFVVLGMALCEETRGIIGRQEISYMKQGAILVNSARGALIDEKALQQALTEGHLKAAALDVVTEEPVTAQHPLHELPNVVLTPHVGANTDEALYRVGMACVDGIRAYLH